MKTSKLIIILLLLVGFTGCKKETFEEVSHTPVPQPFNTNHSKAGRLQAIMDEYTRKGVPGIVVAIKDQEGTWEGTSGFAKIESNQKLMPGLVHTGGSITKTYLAAAILKLQELNQLELDKPITDFLPANVTSKITSSNIITVRMLLNHTSGIPDYIENFNFKLHWFNNLTQKWTATEALAYAYNKPLLFKPGSQFSYSNTNYILLSLLLEHVTQQPEGKWLQQHILKPLQLNHTYYKTQPEYLNQLPMPNYYLDRYGDGRHQNITAAAKTEMYSELGDGGLVASALDFVSFLDALANGKIVSEAAFNNMITPAFNDYGLGIDIYKFKDKPAYGHSGAVLGGSAFLLYFPDRKTTVFIGSNTDADLVPGKTFFLYHDMKNKIGDFISSNS